MSSFVSKIDIGVMSVPLRFFDGRPGAGGFSVFFDGVRHLAH